VILPDRELRAWAERNVTPYDPEMVNPASIDLRVGCDFINLRDNSPFRSDEFWIHPGQAYLATTIEYISMPPDCAGTVYLKSSMARKGLDHALAGWVDPGFFGTLTLELHSHRPFKIMANQPIIQLVLQRCSSPPEKPYQGKYQGQRGPTEAR
jgi:dCTP deaminase